MKSLVKYLFIASLAALALNACVPEFEDESLNPKGSPVQFTLSGDSGVLTGNTIAVKVTSTVPVATDIEIKLALGDSATVKAANMEFPEMIIPAGGTEVSGTINFNTTGLKGATEYLIVVKGSISGVDLAQKLKLTFTTLPDPPKPDAENFTIDGKIDDWSDKEDIYTINCGEGAALNGIKSIKVHYGAKLHFLLELTDDAIAKGVADKKLYFHVLFNGDNNNEGGLKHKWLTADIDYMIEGKIMDKGAFCEYKSNYYKRNTTDPTEWKWADTKVAPSFVSAGDGNYYELSMDYGKYPGRGGLANIFTIGFDLADANYNVIGFLPNTSADAPCAKALIKKSGFPIPDPDGFSIDGDPSEWSKTWGVVEMACPKEAKVTGIKSVKMHNNNKLHFLLEFTDAIIASPDSLILHIYFGGSATGIKRYWQEEDIFYMIAGMMRKDGEFLDFNPLYYSWMGSTYPTEWAWKETGANPVFVSAGKGSYLEMSMDYSNYPGGLPNPLTMGFEITGSDFTTLGYLPQATVAIPQDKDKDPKIELVPAEKALVEKPAPWDATPSFKYQEDDNLWHKIDDATALRYFYHRNPGWVEPIYNTIDSVACPFVSKQINTYIVELKEATDGRWQNQLFFHPYDKKNFIALKKENTYKFSVTLGASAPFNGYFKLAQYKDFGKEGTEEQQKKHEGDAIWDKGEVAFTTPYAPVVLEYEFSGVDAPNVLLAFDFGTNPANTKVYIKDIILSEVPKAESE